jgi:mannan endo-1,4-beta-mannosidase
MLRSMTATCIHWRCILLLLCLAAQPAGAASSAPFWGVALDGYPIDAQRIEQIEQETKLVPRMVVFFLQWPADPQQGEFPHSSLEAIWQKGAIACVTWEPMHYADGMEKMVPHQSITSGVYDDYLQRFARGARSWGKPFIIRLAHEMNLDRYHWGVEKDQYGPGSPEIYRSMFRHVVSVFKREGADNVLWAFCPNAESVPNSAGKPAADWNRAGAYYPGDAFVDIVGMDGYNWGTTRTVAEHGWQSRWRSFAEIFSPLYEELRRLAPAKPVIIFETGSADAGGDKHAWLRQAIETVNNWSVRAVNWFQADKEVDWRINSSGFVFDAAVPRPAPSAARQWLRELIKKRR